MAPYLIRILLYALAFLCFFPSGTAQQRLLHPSNVKVVGFDKEINNNGTHMIVLRSFVKVLPGTRLGLTNGIYDSSGAYFASPNGGGPSYVEVVYNGSVSLPEHALLAIAYGPAQLPAIYNVNDGFEDISDAFTLSGSQAYANPSKTQSDHVFLYQGAMQENAQGKHQVNGSVIGGFSFTGEDISVPEALDPYFQGRDIGLDGAGVLNCNDTKTICEIIPGQDLDNWISIPSSDNNDLIPTVTEHFDCNQCDNLELLFCPQKCIDVAFLIDCSGSVNSSEYGDMITSIQATMEKLAETEHSIRYSVYKFAEYSEFELTTPFTYDVTEAQNIGGIPASWDRDFTSISSAVNNVKQSHDSENKLREAVEYIFLIYTDAPQSQNRNPYYQIRDEPYNADLFIMKYPDGLDKPTTFTELATVASIGGAYNKFIYYDPADPDGPGVRPRQLLVASGFSDPFPGLVDGIVDCPRANSVYVHSENSICSEADFDWSTVNGDFQSSYPSGAVEKITKGGQYTVEVQCEGRLTACDLITINIPSVDPICGSGEGGGKEKEISGYGGEEVGNGLSLDLFPNPSMGTIHLQYTIPTEVNEGIIRILSNGANIYHQVSAPADGVSHTLTLNNVPSGIYYAELITNKGIVSQEFTVIK